MRRLTAILVACAAGAGLYAQSASQSTGWQTYAGDAQGRRYSPLTQINTTNVSRLKLAWQYGVANAAAGSTVNAVGRSQAVPIVMRGVLYTSTTRRTIVALDPATGTEIWKFDLEKGGAPNRGVSYWPGDGGLARELGLRFGRRRTRAPVPANRPACVAVLRRPSRAEESVLLVGSRTRGQHRQSPLELSADAPRPVGLRQLGNARAGRCHAERPAHSRRRHRREVGPDVLSRANHGQADLSRRRAARA